MNKAGNFLVEFECIGLALNFLELGHRAENLYNQRPIGIQLRSRPKTHDINLCLGFVYTRLDCFEILTTKLDSSKK